MDAHQVFQPSKLEKVGESIPHVSFPMTDAFIQGVPCFLFHVEGLHVYVCNRHFIAALNTLTWWHAFVLVVFFSVAIFRGKGQGTRAQVRCLDSCTLHVHVMCIHIRVFQSMCT